MKQTTGVHEKYAKFRADSWGFVTVNTIRSRLKHWPVDIFLCIGCINGIRFTCCSPELMEFFKALVSKFLDGPRSSGHVLFVRLPVVFVAKMVLTKIRSDKTYGRQRVQDDKRGKKLRELRQTRENTTSYCRHLGRGPRGGCSSLRVWNFKS